MRKSVYLAKLPPQPVQERPSLPHTAERVRVRVWVRGSAVAGARLTGTTTRSILRQRFTPNLEIILISTQKPQTFAIHELWYRTQFLDSYWFTKLQNFNITAMLASSRPPHVSPPFYTRQASTYWPLRGYRDEKCSNVTNSASPWTKTFKRYRDSWRRLRQSYIIHFRVA